MPLKYDLTLKDLVLSGAPALLRQLVGAPAVEVLPTEYPAVRSRHPDLVARLADGRIYHLELQSGPDSHMAWRMLDYYALIAARYGDAAIVQQVLLVGGRGGTIGGGIDRPTLSFRYTVVDIRAIDPAPLLESPAVEDNVLAFLCRCDDLQERVREILRRLAQRAPAERDAAAERLLLLSGLRDAERLVVEEVQAMPITIDIERNPFLNEILARGRAEGRAEGRTEGRTEGEARALLRQLERRFGPLPQSVRERVAAAGLDQLDLWLDRVLDAPDLDAVFAPPRR